MMQRFLAALLVLLVLTQSAFAWGTPTSVGTNGNASGATIALSSVTAPGGDLLVVVVQEFSGTLGSISDSAGNTYTLATSRASTAGTWTFNGSSGTAIEGIYYANNITALSSGSITYTKHTSGVGAAISAFYVSGAASSSPIDTAVTNSAFGSGFTATVTSGGASNSGELFVGAVACSGFTATQASGWSAPPNAINIAPCNISTGMSFIGGNLVNAGTSAKTYNPTFSNSTTWLDIVVAFIPTGGAPPVTSFFLPPGMIP